MCARKWWAALPLVVSLIWCAATVAQTSIVDFENYTEGFLGYAFTDLTTGVTFSDPVRQGEPLWFAVEWGGPPPGQQGFFFGNFLVCGGFAVGDPPSLPANFSFSARLPYEADIVTLDVNATPLETTGAVTLEALDSAGVVVGSASRVVQSFGEKFQLSVTSPTSEIASVRIVPDEVFNAVDNLTFIPEPAGTSFAAAAATLAALLRRSRCC